MSPSAAYPQKLNAQSTTRSWKAIARKVFEMIGKQSEHNPYMV